MPFHHFWVHPSAGLDQWSKWRLHSLRTGQLYHGFHYQSLQQSKLWLEVFLKHSPVATSRSVTSIYHEIAETVAHQFSGQTVHVISLGCGDGRKDLLLIEALVKNGAQVKWTPQDISLALVLETAKSVAHLPLLAIQPMVADLMSLKELGAELAYLDESTPRIVTYYGLVPNFEPDFLLSSWQGLLRSADHLLVSANLSPAKSESKSAYLTATEQILPQYDNPETERWLTSILRDWGIEDSLNNYRVRLESRHELLRLVAVMDWNRSMDLPWEKETVPIRAGDNLRLFFSYRHTPQRFRDLCRKASLNPLGEWIAPSREEGVWWLSDGI